MCLMLSNLIKVNIQKFVDALISNFTTNLYTSGLLVHSFSNRLSTVLYDDSYDHSLISRSARCSSDQQKIPHNIIPLYIVVLHCRIRISKCLIYKIKESFFRKSSDFVTTVKTATFKIISA